jgi:hypothetical protein
MRRSWRDSSADWTTRVRVKSGYRVSFSEDKISLATHLQGVECVAIYLHIPSVFGAWHRGNITWLIRIAWPDMHRAPSLQNANIEQKGWPPDADAQHKPVHLCHFQTLWSEMLIKTGWKSVALSSTEQDETKISSHSSETQHSRKSCLTYRNEKLDAILTQDIPGVLKIYKLVNLLHNNKTHANRQLFTSSKYYILTLWFRMFIN